MLVLTRFSGQSITIGDHMVITVAGVTRAGSVHLRIGRRQHELAEGYTADIEPGVTVKLLRVHAGRATLGFTAPKKIAVHRLEIYERIQAEKLEIARRQRMPERVGQVIAGVFLALSAWPAYLLQMAVIS